jgi:adenylate cyclase
MKRKYKIRYAEWLLITVGWIIVFYLYFIFSWWGTSSFLQQGWLTEYLNSPNIHYEIIIQAVIFGLLFNTINTVISKSELSKKSFGMIIFVKTILYSIAITFSQLFVFLVFYIFDVLPTEQYKQALDLLNFEFVLSLSLYFTLSITFFNFMLQLSRKFGPGNMLKMLIGKYYKPREEQRIFLFLDLRNSTGIAEYLGHKNYSRFLQSCFHDITEIVIKYKAEVYQYVGDEVVLTWKIKDGLESLNCVKAFFAFENKLLRRKEFYEKQFNTFPEFKGGMDMGLVTVAEIGDIKRDIAYHGDVLNTASRIQHQCNKLNKKLLISKNLECKIEQLNGFDKEFIGEIQLRGKEHTTEVYSLEYRDN